MSYSGNGNTVSFNAMCENDMYSRDGSRYVGINTAYRVVTLEYGSNGWYVNSAQYQNSLNMSGNTYKVY